MAIVLTKTLRLSGSEAAAGSLQLLGSGDEEALVSRGDAQWLFARPAERNASSNTVVLLGDSITANEFGWGAAYRYRYANGIFNWANVRLGQRFKVLNIAGIGGNNAWQMADRFQRDVLAYGPANVIIGGPTNDIGTDVSATVTKARLREMWSMAEANGIRVCQRTILPRETGGSGLTQAQRNRLMAMNDWIREQMYVGTDRVLLDSVPYMQDAANANGNPQTSFCYDSPQLHPAPLGAMWAAEADVAAFQYLIAPTNRLKHSQGDVYDATDNPTGNMLGSDGAMQTLDTLTGTGLAGSKPTTWTGQRVAGNGTMTGSAVARTDGVHGNWFRMSIASATAATEQYQLRKNLSGPTASGTTYAIGDTVEAEAELRITQSGSTPYVLHVCVTATEYDRDGNVVMVSASLYKYQSTLQRVQDWSGVARTTPFVTSGSAGSGASQRITVSIDILFVGTTTNALVVDVGRVSLRKRVA